MTFLEAIIMAWKDIMRAKMRSFLTMLGVIIGIFSVISLVTLGEGMKGFMYEQIDRLGTGPTYMEVHGGKEGELAAMATVKITLADAKAIEERCPSCELVDPRNIQSGKITYLDKSYTSPIISGSTPALMEQMNWGVSEGRFISHADVDARKKVVVLGQDLAKKLFGSFAAVGEKVRINGTKFLVIGLLKRKGTLMGFNMDEYVVIPVTTAEDVFETDRLGEIGVVAKSVELVPQAVAEIKEVLLERHGTEDIRVDTMENSMAMLDTVMNALTAIVTGIAAISLLVGGIGIMNIMLVAVNERVREIGVRKAIGAKKRDILVQFLTESVIISLMGGVIGIVSGVGLATLIMLVIGMPLTISVWAILLATFVAIFVGVTSGVYPAMRAARLDPVEALRYE
ncbi:MAG: ABC transporter permease [Candidatus Margulisbacteria bacterium]|nr:ABC transporter permease [Candidatus Margulisiibacteriota bacterium]